MRHRNVKHGCNKAMFALPVLLGLLAAQQPAHGQTARVALDTYEEGPVWQKMIFRAAPGKTEMHLRNIAMAWEHQLKRAVTKYVLIDYKVLTTWPSSPDDWNIMVVEIFPNMASYDTFWEERA